MTAATLFIAPVMNAMGPATDPRHPDLLTSWDEVDHGVSRIFAPSYRGQYPDSAGAPAVFSWFFVDWTGFRSNPVKRDFGPFTIYDHYRSIHGDQLDRYGDGLYWMYNHPAASGVGNEWGMDWLQNTHYLQILARYVIDRSYFPSVVQIPTEGNHSSHWLEQWFPFDLGNRNCADLDPDAREADGKASVSVIDWKGAPDDWSEYHPHPDDHRAVGPMRRTIFRLLDIKTRIYQLRESEIRKAFQRCRAGQSTMLAAYEHDFRDRSATIAELFLGPIARLGQEFPDVPRRYASARDAARAILGAIPSSGRWALSVVGDDIRIAGPQPFGPTPFVCSRDVDADQYAHHPVTVVGAGAWQLRRSAVPRSAILGVAANDPSGRTIVQRFRSNGDGWSEVS